MGRLAVRPPAAYTNAGRWPDGRSAGLRPGGEESPGSTETRCRVTPGGGDPRDSATESKPPGSGRVRVKGCGKSAPRGRQRSRHGKPHREQDRIGAGRLMGNHGPTGVSACRPGWSREATGDRRPRGMAIPRPAVRKDTGLGTEPGLQAICRPFSSIDVERPDSVRAVFCCLTMRTKEKRPRDWKRNKHPDFEFVPVTDKDSFKTAKKPRIQENPLISHVLTGPSHCVPPLPMISHELPSDGVDRPLPGCGRRG